MTSSHDVAAQAGLIPEPGNLEPEVLHHFVVVVELVTDHGVVRPEHKEVLLQTKGSGFDSCHRKLLILENLSFYSL